MPDRSLDQELSIIMQSFLLLKHKNWKGAGNLKIDARLRKGAWKRAGVVRREFGYFRTTHCGKGRLEGWWMDIKMIVVLRVLGRLGVGRCLCLF